jgi:hypothetical protein
VSPKVFILEPLYYQLCGHKFVFLFKFGSQPFLLLRTFENERETCFQGVFWYVTPCSLVEVYRRFAGVFCLHLQWCVVVYWSIRCRMTQKLKFVFYYRASLKMLFTCVYYMSSLLSSRVFCSLSENVGGRERTNFLFHPHPPPLPCCLK